MSQITVRSVESSKDLKQFINFMWDVYKNDPTWCPPFKADLKKLFNRNKSPFFLHGDMKLFLAEKNGKVVGRIAGVRNDAHNEVHEDKVGFFGFYESFDDQEVCNALLDQAKSWLKNQGFDKMRGPASPSANEEYGCQYTGFEHDQVLLSTHNAPYYKALFEGYGLHKEIDLNAYYLDGKKIIQNDKIRRVWEIAQKRSGLKIVEMDKKDFRGTLDKFKVLYNKCWTKNHGFVPLTDEEFDFIAGDLETITDPRQVLFGEIDGEIVGGTIVLPDYNQIFKTMNGSLFPFNWIKVFTQKKKITAIRVVILGIDPQHQRKGIDGALYYEIVRRGLEFGYQWAEASYVLEDNEMMNRPMEMIGGEVYKKYRVFQQDI